MNAHAAGAEAAKVAVNYDIHDFVRGQKDCREGVPHQSGNSESYDMGYSFEYELEQVLGKNGNN